jgi:hypothetical protein
MKTFGESRPVSGEHVVELGESGTLAVIPARPLGS